MTTTRAPAAPVATVLDVVDVAEGEHAGQIHAGNGGLNRLRAGREHELGERKMRTARERHRARDGSTAVARAP